MEIAEVVEKVFIAVNNNDEVEGVRLKTVTDRCVTKITLVDPSKTGGREATIQMGHLRGNHRGNHMSTMYEVKI